LRYFNEGGDINAFPSSGHFDPNGSDGTWLNSLADWFQGDSTLHQQAADAITSFRDHQHYQEFVNSNKTADGKILFSYDDELQMAMMSLDGFNPSAALKQINQQIEKKLEGIFGAMNPEELLAYILCYIDGSTFDQVGFLGNDVEWMKKRTSEMNGLLSQWTSGHFDANSAKSFIETIHSSLWKYNNPNGDEIVGQIMTAIDKDFLKMPTTYYASKGTPLPPPLTVDQLYSTNGNVYDSKGNSVDAQTALATQLNNWNLPSNPGDTVPPQYTTIQNSFKTATTATTDQGNQIGLQEQNATSNEQAYDNIENNILKMTVDFMTDIARRFASS
jgi:hypothetical protein